MQVFDSAAVVVFVETAAAFVTVGAPAETVVVTVVGVAFEVVVDAGASVAAVAHDEVVLILVAFAVGSVLVIEVAVVDIVESEVTAQVVESEMAVAELVVQVVVLDLDVVLFVLVVEIAVAEVV